jgi:glycosyltransferase involved in cell wall biosynthesis
MNVRPLLSICIPTYNRAALLRRHVETLCNFTKIPLEIVVSDNFSTDATREVMGELCSRFENIRYHRQPQPVSIGYNWHTAISKASGKYAFAVADDDVCIEDQLLDAIHSLEVDQSLMCVYGGYYEVDLGGKVNHVHRKTDDDLYFSKADRLRIVSQFFSFEIPVFRLELYKASTIFHDGAFILSWDFVGACLDQGKIRVSPLLLLRHTIHPDRLTETKASDPSFNFAWISTFESFLADTQCDHGARLNLLINLISRIYYFHAQVCMRNGRALDARFFIKKGMCYSPGDFKSLAIEWEGKHLAAAAVEVLIKSLADQIPARPVWIKDSIPAGIRNAIAQHATLMAAPPEPNFSVTVVGRDLVPEEGVPGWQYFDLARTMSNLMLSGRKLNFS